MTDHIYVERTVIQIGPCAAGTRALYRQDDGSLETGPELVALAVCRAREVSVVDGLKIFGKWSRELCGVEAVESEGLVLCEDTSNFFGYLGPGEKITTPEKAHREG